MFPVFLVLKRLVTINKSLFFYKLIHILRIISGIELVLHTYKVIKKIIFTHLLLFCILCSQCKSLLNELSLFRVLSCDGVCCICAMLLIVNRIFSVPAYLSIYINLFTCILLTMNILTFIFIISRHIFINLTLTNINILHSLYKRYLYIFHLHQSNRVYVIPYILKM